MNIYEKLALLPIGIFVCIMIIGVEIQMFQQSILVSIIGNLSIIWVFYFLHKSEQLDKRSEVVK